ncbi:MAG: hypothetical protein Q8O40_09065 [Chloroflexota bacterium]|nr:hypothetical protein [Chloroflexota bacterium]
MAQTPQIQEHNGVKPLQNLATIQIPPLAAESVVIAVFDHKDGSVRMLDARNFIEALAAAERVHSLDRLDTRNLVQVTVPNLAALAAVVSGIITVPAGEVWFINRLSVTCPAADATGTASHNILVSRFPKTLAGTDKAYLAADVVAMGATTPYDLATVGQLGEELRLEGGDKLTLRLTVTVAFTADKVFTLAPFGRRGKLLVT